MVNTWCAVSHPFRCRRWVELQSTEIPALIRRQTFVPHALSLPTCRKLWRITTARWDKMTLGMAGICRFGTRPYDDVVVICRGMRQSVVKALTSAVGQLRTPATYPCHVRSWVISRHGAEVVGTSVPSQKQTFRRICDPWLRSGKTRAITRLDGSVVRAERSRF